jgi:DNA-binding MarR family transcriptional regulator
MKRRHRELARRAATRMIHATRPLTAGVEARVQAETGYRLVENEALRIVAEADGPVRMSDLARGVILTRAGATKVVDRLEAKGLLCRTKDPGDRRSLIVGITASGREVLTCIGPVVEGAIEELWSRHISEEEAKRVLEVADRVIAANPDWHA